MQTDSEAEQWKAKAERAEEMADKAVKAGDTKNAVTWRESARIYWALAARRETWANAWKPRLRSTVAEEKQDGKSD
jgi:hypothetical protein